MKRSFSQLSAFTACLSLLAFPVFASPRTSLGGSPSPAPNAPPPTLLGAQVALGATPFPAQSLSCSLSPSSTIYVGTTYGMGNPTALRLTITADPTDMSLTATALMIVTSYNWNGGTFDNDMAAGGFDYYENTYGAATKRIPIRLNGTSPVTVNVPYGAWGATAYYVSVTLTSPLGATTNCRSGNIIPTCADDHWSNTYSYTTFSENDAGDNVTFYPDGLGPPYCGWVEQDNTAGWTRYRGYLAGCFSPETRLKMANGLWKRADEIRQGDALWNPVRKTASKIKSRIVGPEDKGLIEIGFQGHRVHVTTTHPMLTPKGIVQAQRLTTRDFVFGEDLKFHPVSVVRRLPPKAGQTVYNFEMDAISPDPADHLVLADGIITGDFFLQSHPGPKPGVVVTSVLSK